MVVLCLIVYLKQIKSRKMLTHATYKKSGQSTRSYYNPSFSWQVQHPNIQQILHKPSLRSKLTIGVYNDKYEQEADCVADQVMRRLN